MAKTNPFEFLQQVREEAAKVTWPSRRETMISTVMVFIMVAVASVFFLVVDLHSALWRAERSSGSPANRAGRQKTHDKALVHRSRLLELREEGGGIDQGTGGPEGPVGLFEQVLVPTEEIIEVRRGRKIKSERRFFPGYVLVKMELTDQAFHLIKNTPKVTGFLGSDFKPIPITDAEAAAS